MAIPVNSAGAAHQTVFGNNGALGEAADFPLDFENLPGGVHAVLSR